MANGPLVVKDGIYGTHPLLPSMFQTELPQLRSRGPGPAHGSLSFDKLIHCYEGSSSQFAPGWLGQDRLERV